MPTTKYAIFKPLQGSYQYVDDFTAIPAIIATAAIDYYVNHLCYGNPYTVVTVNDDGSENWRNPAGETVINPTAIIDEGEIIAEDLINPAPTE